jgi:hypothetical protein
MVMALPGLSPEVSQLLRGVSMQVALLTPETTTRFFDQDDPRSTYIFSADTEGHVQVAIEDQNGKVSQPSPKLSPQK